MAWDMTARGTSFRSFNAGGQRGTVDSVNTGTLLNSMTGMMFAGESRQGLEHFEPFGMTAAIIKKNADGVAEALMSCMAGSRGHMAAGVIGDRRYRPLGLKEGESSQYDDVGQMTLIRRSGVYVVSMDGQGGANAQTPGADNKERMASLRHVEKQKQQRTPMSTGESAGGGGSQSAQPQQQQDYKHEGEKINTEVRCTAKRISFYAKDEEVGYYDVEAKTWCFIGKILLGSKDADMLVSRKGTQTTDGATDQSKFALEVYVPAGP